MKKVITIGGGHGHAQVLKGIKDIDSITITGICPNTDSGGSTGVLQREYGGHGYVGDLTRCAVALSSDTHLAQAMMYRFKGGALDGHLVKNILFHALEKVCSPEEALETLARVCGLGRHRLLPVSNEKAELCATLRIGNTISGETNIDTIAKNPLWNPSVHSISSVYLKPHIQASPRVRETVHAADVIIICPGDLYSSILPTLLPLGMKEAIRASSATIILILNIMTKKGETDNYTAYDFISMIENHLGRKADHIIVNNKPLPQDILLHYSLEQKIELDAHETEHDARIIQAPLAEIVDEQVFTSPSAVREVLVKIFDETLS